jgi:hypothetical protein
MNTPIRLKYLVFPLVLLCLVGSMGMAAAQSGGGYDLSWSTIDGGGVMLSTGAGYALGGTIGQPDAGTSTGSGYSLAGGFWAGLVEQFKVFLPLVLRNH